MFGLTSFYSLSRVVLGGAKGGSCPRAPNFKGGNEKQLVKKLINRNSECEGRALLFLDAKRFNRDLTQI